MVFENVCPSSPPVNLNYQEAITFDNADFRLYATRFNLIVPAKIGIDLERYVDTKLINKQFMPGLEIPSATNMLKDILPNKYDDAEAQTNRIIRKFTSIISSFLLLSGTIPYLLYE